MKQQTLAILREQWFLVMLLVAATIGYVFSSQLQWLSNYNTLFLAGVMFLLGLDKDMQAIIQALKKTKALAFVLVFAFLVSPLLGLFLSKLFLFNYPDLHIGLIVMVSVGGTIGSSILWTRLAGGNDTLSLVLSVLVTMLSALFAPMVLYVILGSSLQFDVLGMLISLVEATILPVIIAQLVKPFLKKQLPAIRKITSPTTQSIILLFMASAMVKAAGALSFGMVAIMIPIVIAHHLAMIVLSYWSAGILGFSHKDRIALMFASSQNTFSTSLYIIVKFFTATAVIPPLVYHLCQQFLAVGVVKWVRRD
ncbi:MAG: bile acid:sodium symporter family protein [bacterium]